MRCKEGVYRSGGLSIILFLSVASKFWAGYIWLVHGIILRYIKARRLALLLVLLRRMLGGVRHALARPAHVVAITIAGCNKGLIAMGAFEIFLLSVRFLMFDHITEFWRWYLTIDAAEKLVGPPCLIIHHVVLDKAKLASVVSVAVTDAFLYCFVQ